MAMIMCNMQKKMKKRNWMMIMTMLKTVQVAGGLTSHFRHCLVIFQKVYAARFFFLCGRVL